MKKKISALIMIIGIALFIVGLFIKIPAKALNTYNFSSKYAKEYSHIDEYVGGDAYNFIIGAALVGGEIAGAKTQKAVFITGGLLIASMGALVYFKDRPEGAATKAESGENDMAAQAQT